MKNTKPIHKETITPLFWLWLPIIWIFGQLTAEIMLTKDALVYLHSEQGIHEWIQLTMLIVTFWLACRCHLRMDKTYSLFFRLWVFLIILGSFYVAAEEISWGQSIFKWSTPETWQKLNYQNETNLHNTSRLFNQVPRFFLEAGVIVGGIFIPFLLWLKPKWLPKTLSLIYPPSILSVTAIIYVLAKFSHKGSKVFFDEKIFYRSSEVEELYLYFFVMLYTLALTRRLTSKET